MLLSNCNRLHQFGLLTRSSIALIPIMEIGFALYLMICRCRVVSIFTVKRNRKESAPFSKAQKHAALRLPHVKFIQMQTNLISVFTAIRKQFAEFVWFESDNRICDVVTLCY